jgi:Rrf2 family iron-sulfur cluster assembly transcriptional regulator
MLLTTKGRYAVMAIVDLAQQEPNKPAKMLDIAKRQDISANYLEQIFNKLKKANILTAQKGPGGGYKLTNSSNKIYVSEIIKAVEEPIKFTRCDHKTTCTESRKKCQTHILWKSLENQIQKHLSNISIEDICTGKIANLN